MPCAISFRKSTGLTRRRGWAFGHSISASHGWFSPTLFPLGILQLYHSISVSYYDARTLDYIGNHANSVFGMAAHAGGISSSSWAGRCLSSTFRRWEFATCEMAIPSRNQRIFCLPMWSLKRRSAKPLQSVSLEFMLMLGYAVLLGVMALLLEFAARHAHRRSLSISTTGVHLPCRQGHVEMSGSFQHLFPVFVDHSKGSVIYRAPASACNACRCKSHCTDSNNGREIERKMTSDLQYGMQRFHRAMSVTLLVLAGLILIVEFFRDDAVYPRIMLASVLMVVSVWSCYGSRRYCSPEMRELRACYELCVSSLAKLASMRMAKTR